MAGSAHLTFPTIRAYRSDGDRWHFQAATGRDDFQYHQLAITGLLAPTAGEVWVVASGRNITANGLYTLFAMYAFDGTDWRTVWKPFGEWDASLVAEDGAEHFVIHREPINADRPIGDTYRVTADGPLLVR